MDDRQLCLQLLKEMAIRIEESPKGDEEWWRSIRALCEQFDAIRQSFDRSRRPPIRFHQGKPSGPTDRHPPMIVTCRDALSGEPYNSDRLHHVILTDRDSDHERETVHRCVRRWIRYLENLETSHPATSWAGSAARLEFTYDSLTAAKESQFPCRTSATNADSSTAASTKSPGVSKEVVETFVVEYLAHHHGYSEHHKITNVERARATKMAEELSQQCDLRINDAKGRISKSFDLLFDRQDGEITGYTLYRHLSQDKSRLLSWMLRQTDQGRSFNAGTRIMEAMDVQQNDDGRLHQSGNDRARGRVRSSVYGQS